MLEQLATIDKTMLETYVGTADEDFFEKVDRALAVSVGVEPINYTKRHNKKSSERLVKSNGDKN